jgi:hypothetical protein
LCTAAQREQRLLLYRLAHGWRPDPAVAKLPPQAVTRVLADSAAHARMQHRLAAAAAAGRDFQAQLLHTLAADAPVPFCDAPHLAKCVVRSLAPGLRAVDSNGEQDSADPTGENTAGAGDSGSSGGDGGTRGKRRKRQADEAAVQRGRDVSRR